MTNKFKYNIFENNLKKIDHIFIYNDLRRSKDWLVYGS